MAAAVTGWLFPWPTPEERQAAIEEARREKEISQGSLAHAHGVLRSIEQLARDNHYAERIARQIMGGDRR